MSRISKTLCGRLSGGCGHWRQAEESFRRCGLASSLMRLSTSALEIPFFIGEDQFWYLCILFLVFSGGPYQYIRGAASNSTSGQGL